MEFAKRRIDHKILEDGVQILNSYGKKKHASELGKVLRMHEDLGVTSNEKVGGNCYDFEFILNSTFILNHSIIQ